MFRPARNSEPVNVAVHSTKGLLPNSTSVSLTGDKWRLHLKGPFGFKHPLYKYGHGELESSCAVELPFKMYLSGGETNWAPTFNCYLEAARLSLHFQLRLKSSCRIRESLVKKEELVLQVLKWLRAHKPGCPTFTMLESRELCVYV